jgi:hypothetical protein
MLVDQMQLAEGQLLPEQQILALKKEQFLVYTAGTPRQVSKEQKDRN